MTRFVLDKAFTGEMSGLNIGWYSMPSFDPEGSGVVFLVVSGCKGAFETPQRCATLIAQGSQVNVIATPTAAKWVDSDRIESITGWPVRHEMRTPNEPTFTPLGNRVLASPVSLNTLTKWTAGHADNLAVGLLCEALGAGIPIEAEIQLSEEFANHPATLPAIKTLTRYGVTIRTCSGGFDIERMTNGVTRMSEEN